MRSLLMLFTFGVAAAASAPGLASAPRAGTAPDVDRVQLAVVDSGGASCPRDAVLTAWAHTNGPGEVRFVIHNSGGGKTGELKADAVAGAAGTYLATYRHTFKITTDVDLRYMAEVSGTGKTSNWVPFKATCGPQARATTSATGASGQPPARTATESRARESTGKPTAGGGTPPASSKPPAKPASDSKPNSQGESSGSSKPNSGGDDARQCGRKITVTRYAALNREAGKATALVTWMAAVVQDYPDSWKDWNNASDRDLGCKRAGALWTCSASARPCEP
ncbi:hypothetical protein GCM10011521_01480 [Arenimonas soli]|uniref:Secreted protein n=1 Tax=Arenimonas soli TaxID=2269504 RepID=A0ABQ1H9N3_9GAMM|nr:hypothetical protein [Arenimonas soli]GGA67082.1 hypothetical protein GCM10011521_01480 [Arenimonas soli]